MLRRLCLAFGAALALGPVFADTSTAGTEQALRSSHAALQDRLHNNAFMRALVLESEELPDRLSGHIHAVVAVAFERLRPALDDPAQWCALLSLHSNTKYCRAGGPPDARTLLLYAGSKSPQPLASALRMDMAFVVVTDTPGLLAVDLRARNGPLGSSDYHVVFEAIPLPDGSSYVHLGYSTATNLAARVAMQAYLATAGRGKVGFTRTGTDGDGQPIYMGGTRGAIERNTMRYFLAIDAYLGSTLAPAAQQLEARLQAWFSAVEQYPRQLHEMDRQTYVEMKRAEHARQQLVP
jgi:hypothetical protein